MRDPPSIPEIEPREPSRWEEALWFAIAYRHPALGMSVMMTRKWAAYEEEFGRLTEAGIPFSVWCGTYRDVEAFRKRHVTPPPHDET